MKIDAIKEGYGVTELQAELGTSRIFTEELPSLGTSSFSMLLASHLTLLLFLTKSKAYVSPGCMGASILGIFGH